MKVKCADKSALLYATLYAEAKPYTKGVALVKLFNNAHIFQSSVYFFNEWYF